MGKLSNTDTINEKRLKIMDKILDKIDFELDLISSNNSYNSIGDHKMICENVIKLADAFNRLDLWEDDEVL